MTINIYLLVFRSFYPFSWLNSGRLSEPRQTNKQWNKIFELSYAIHFYHGSTRLTSKSESRILSAKHYGARKPAYLVLALQYCPVAFQSVDGF